MSVLRCGGHYRRITPLLQEAGRHVSLSRGARIGGARG
jgi:hypothetical protein